MALRDILDKEIIELNLEGNNKDEVLRNLSKKLLDAGYITDVDSFVTDIYEREKEGPTGMGNGISIPHGKSNAVKKIGIAIGKCVNDIPWESSMSENNMQLTNLIFLFCVSNDNDFAANHMMLLAELAGKLGNDARIKKLQNVVTKDELIDAIVCDMEESITSDANEGDIDIDINVL